MLGFDCVVLDEEHAPWTRATLDQSLLAARAAGTAGIVRIGRPDAASVLSVLDDGAIGVMCPHVDSAEKARNLVSWAKSSEERSVGKECVSTCRSRWSPFH